MAPRILYLATADARGHLMRAQLLTHALRAIGSNVQLLTTSAAGRRFLAGFGLDAAVLSPHYAVQFDTRQNMLRQATDRNVARYVFDPRRMLRDMVRLCRYMREADLVVNDSFHPALLVLGALPGWRKKIVHIYGTSLYAALQANFDGRLPQWMARVFRQAIAWQVQRAAGCIEHDFACAPDPHGTVSAKHYRLPTPVAVVESTASETATPMAAVYLNPHFQTSALAEALETGLADAGLAAHCVGEGYAQRPGWVAQDAHWVEAAARSALIVSSPGMAALSVALVYGKPILLICTDQPEQQANVQRAQTLDLWHRSVIWRAEGRADLRGQVARAARELQALPRSNTPTVDAKQRLTLWTEALMHLATRAASY